MAMRRKLIDIIYEIIYLGPTGVKGDIPEASRSFFGRRWNLPMGYPCVKG
jgi:hypothetical protein